MTKFTRNRGQKRLRARSAAGRFCKTTLDGLREPAGWMACSSCGRFFERFTLEGEPFLSRVYVKACPHCGAPTETST